MSELLLGFDVEELEANGSYWCAKEIAQQPQIWEEAVARIESQRQQIDAWIKPLLANERLRITLSGAGTSSFIGETIAPWLGERLSRRVDTCSTTDIVGDPRKCFPEDIPTLMISFARSGDSPESAASVDLANQLLTECHHLVLTCNPDGQLAKSIANDDRGLCLLMPEAAHDRGFAMTSSFTSMMISTVTVFAPDNKQLNTAARVTEKLIAQHASTAREYANRKYSRLVVLGAGCLFGIAQEAALKCLELSAGHLVSLYDSPLGFRHGPKSVVDDQTLIFLLQSSNGYSALYDRDLARELRRDFGDDRIANLSSGFLGFSEDKLDEFWISLPYVVYCQMFAFFTALVHHIPADNPCPTGEVNRVVQGVEIHEYSDRIRESLDRKVDGI